MDEILGRDIVKLAVNETEVDYNIVSSLFDDYILSIVPEVAQQEIKEQSNEQAYTSYFY